MMPFSEASVEFRYLCLILFLLLILMELVVIFVNIMVRKNKFRILLNFLLLGSTMFVYSSLQAIHQDYRDILFIRNHIDLSISFIFLYLAIAMVYFLVSFRLDIIRYNNMINRNSTKEALDNIPVGICFFNEKGQIVLINHQMFYLWDQLKGFNFKNLKELREKLKDPTDTVDCIDQELKIYCFQNGRVWRFTESYVQDRWSRKYIQFIATDITNIMVTKQELEKEHQKLSKTSKRIKTMIKNVNELTRAEEILSLKMRVHNDLGQSIIATKKILQEEEKMEYAQEVIENWKSSINLLKNTNNQQLQEDPLTQLKEAAKGIGVDILLEGALPEDEKIAYLIITALRECATNVARHTDGNELYGRINSDGNRIRVFIENNGSPPKREIIEGGGLHSLRKKIENIGGIMAIQSFPNYRLTISLPVKSEELL